MAKKSREISFFLGKSGVLKKVLYGEALHKMIKTTTFPRLFNKHGMHLLALLSLFTHGNDRFPYPFINLNL